MDRSTLLGLNHFKNKDNILVIESPTAQSANETISEILEKYCDLKTALFLSGGNTPKKLYEYIASQKKLKVGAVGQVDERFGEKLHKKSNELMIKETGLLDYFETSNLRFYPVIEGSVDLETASKNYDEALRFILKYFPKSVGIMGLGEDGHTAGIPAIPEISKKNGMARLITSDPGSPESADGTPARPARILVQDIKKGEIILDQKRTRRILRSTLRRIFPHHTPRPTVDNFDY